MTIASGHETAPSTRQPRLPAGPVLLITLAIYGQEIVWNFFDAQVPAELRRYVGSAAVIGLIMGIDNVFGIVLQPWMGLLSDRRLERRGSRLAFVVIGAPVAAVPFAFIPFAPNLAVLVLCIVVFAGVANAFKPSNESLLADYVAPPLRARANGFIKLGTALTVATSAVISLTLVDDHLSVAFLLPPALMVGMLWLAAVFLRGRDRHVTTDQVDEEVERPKVRAIYADLLTRAGRPRLLLVLGIIGFNGIWQAMRSLFTVYGVETLDLSRGEAGSLSLLGAAAFIVAAVPISLLTRRYGPIRMIRVGLAIFFVGLVLGGINPTVATTVAGLALASIGFACFAINALVAMWEMAPSSRTTGAYTGLYAVAYSLGAAIGPALLGLFVDLTEWRWMMLGAAGAAALVHVVFARLERVVARSA